MHTSTALPTSCILMITFGKLICTHICIDFFFCECCSTGLLTVLSVYMYFRQKNTRLYHLYSKSKSEVNPQIKVYAMQLVLSIRYILHLNARSFSGIRFSIDTKSLQLKLQSPVKI